MFKPVQMYFFIGGFTNVLLRWTWSVCKGGERREPFIYPYARTKANTFPVVNSMVKHRAIALMAFALQILYAADLLCEPSSRVAESTSSRCS